MNNVVNMSQARFANARSYVQSCRVEVFKAIGSAHDRAGNAFI